MEACFIRETFFDLPRVDLEKITLKEVGDKVLSECYWRGATERVKAVGYLVGYVAYFFFWFAVGYFSAQYLGLIGALAIVFTLWLEPVSRIVGTPFDDCLEGMSRCWSLANHYSEEAHRVELHLFELEGRARALAG